MSVNLLSLESSALLGDFSHRASAFLGESENKVVSAIKAFVPAVLGSLVQKASTRSGADSLMRTLNSSDVDAGLSSNPSKLFTNSDPAIEMQNGHHLLGEILGDKLDSVADTVASMSGMSSESASHLMDLSSPVMLSVLKKEADVQHLDAPGLTGMLSSQAGYLQNALDSRLLRALGVGSAAALLGSMAGKVAAGASAMTGAAGAAGSSMMQTASPLMRFLPWVVVIGAMLAGLWMLRSCAAYRSAGLPPDMVSAPTARAGAGTGGTGQVGMSGMGTGSAGSSMTSPASGTTSAGSMAMGSAAGAAATDAGAMSSPAVSSSSGMEGAAAVAGMAMVGTQVFFDVGSVGINSAGYNAIDSVAVGMKGKSGRLEITGYTDKTGSLTANQVLARQRSVAVRAALVSAGIPASQISMKPSAEVEANAANGSTLSDAQARRVDIVPVQ